MWFSDRPLADPVGFRHDPPMRTFLLAVSALLLAPSVASADEPAPAADIVGSYYGELGPDGLAALGINADGSFDYALAAGALNEQASGRWTRMGNILHITTTPRPVPAEFTALPPSKAQGALSVKVVWPDGSGIAGIDVTIGFDSGEPVTGYTQEEDGWALPAGETRTPRWIRLREPVHDVGSPEYPIDPAAGTALAFRFIPNDLGIFDFRDALVEIDGAALIVHRGESQLRFVPRPR